MNTKTLAWVLSLLGLIPFAYPIVHQYYQVVQWWELNLVFSYAAIILSFIAGIHWGKIIYDLKTKTATLKLIYSSVIACIAWFFIVFDVPYYYFIGFFLVILLCDFFIYWQEQLKWFAGLRVTMTLAIVVLLFYNFGMSKPKPKQIVTSSAAAPSMIRTLIMD